MSILGVADQISVGGCRAGQYCGWHSRSILRVAQQVNIVGGRADRCWGLQSRSTLGVVEQVIGGGGKKSVGGKGGKAKSWEVKENRTQAFRWSGKGGLLRMDKDEGR